MFRKYKWLFISLLLAISVGIIFLFRISFLLVAFFLTEEDPLPQKADVMFGFSGAAKERGIGAAKLYHAGIVKRIICTGEIITHDMEVLKLPYKESDITKQCLRNEGVPDSCIQILPVGTSTWDEYLAIDQYCVQKQFRSVILLSTKFHTNRIHRLFSKTQHQNLQYYVSGTPSIDYKENEWWKYEQGLIFVNNECLKTIYYWLKH